MPTKVIKEFSSSFSLCQYRVIFFHPFRYTWLAILLSQKKIRQQRVLKAFFQESEEIDRVFVNEGKKTPKQWVRLPPFNCIVNEMSVFLDEPKYHHWINSFVMFQKPNILFGFRLDVSIEVNILHFSFGSFGFRSRFFSHTLNLGSSFSGKSFDLG